jgi:hypothetical protein
MIAEREESWLIVLFRVQKLSFSSSLDECYNSRPSLFGWANQQSSFRQALGHIEMLAVELSLSAKTDVVSK